MKKIKKQTNSKIKHGNVELEPGTFEPKNVKERVTCLIDEDVVNWLRSEAEKTGGIGYQTLLNLKLRESMDKPNVEHRLAKIEAVLFKTNKGA